MRYALLLLSTLLCLSGSAQVAAWKDSVRMALKNEPKFYVSLHNRNTFLQAEPVHLYGLAGGVDFEQKLRLYMGIYGFGRQNVTTFYNDDRFVNDTVTRRSSVWNLSVGAEYQFYHKDAISLSIPVQVGVGQLRYRFEDVQTLHENYLAFPLEFGTNASYELIPWVLLKGGVGYRFMAGRSKVLSTSSPYYNLGLAILIGKVYEDVSEY